MQTALPHPVRFTSARSFAASVPGKFVFGLAATVVVAVAAHIAVPLPFTPVPLTLQPLAVLGVGLALGPATGFAAMLAYLAEGALGLPVFSPTGVGGVAQILGPTGGFLMAYPLVAAIAGGLTRISERKLPRFGAAALASTVAVVVLFVLGAAWFAHLTHAPAPYVWRETVLPFLPGEAIKVLAAAGIYSAFTRSTRT